jgi:hypothetical protein
MEDSEPELDISDDDENEYDSDINGEEKLEENDDE